MATNNTIPTEFVPLAVGAMDVGRYIQKGGETSGAYLKGMADLASNHNYLLAKSGHVVVNQTDVASIAWAAGDIKWAEYRVRIPKLLNRLTLTVKVTATSTGGNYQVRAKIGATTTAYSVAAASGTQTLTIALDNTTAIDDYDYLELEFKMSAAGNFLPTQVLAYSTWQTGALDSLSAAGTPYQTACVPQDPNQYNVDEPLAVTMLKDMAAGAKHMHAMNMRCIANWSLWANWTSINSLDAGLAIERDAAITRAAMVRQFIYVRRDGVNNINWFVRCRLDGYTATPGKIVVDWLEHSTIDALDVNSSSSVWYEQGVQVPNTMSPGLLRLAGLGGESVGKTLYIHSFAIWDSSVGVE